MTLQKLGEIAVDREWAGRDEEKTRRPIALFLLPTFGKNWYNMFAVCERRGPNPKSMLSRPREGDRDGSFGMGYVTTESRLYMIGGDIHVLRREKEKEYPKNVFYCNMSYGEEGVVCGKWEQGPSLLGGKPNPLLVVVNRKIYALAGHSYVWSSVLARRDDDDDDDDDGGGGDDDDDDDVEEDSNDDKYVGVRSPIFEVLDPLKDKWETLPPPPFRLIYGKRGPTICWHTVIGNVIYMHVRDRLSNYRYGGVLTEILYSFDTDAVKWYAYNANPSPSNNIDDELIRENLREMMICASRTEVVGNKFYWFSFCHNDVWCGGDRVFALDLTCRSEDMCPVRGLTHVTESIDRYGAQGFLTHLGRNNFCLVILFSFRTGCYARTCTFEVDELKPATEDGTFSLVATNIYYEDHQIDDFMEISNYVKWCKIPGPS